jgi:hypothetical protein
LSNFLKPLVALVVSILLFAGILFLADGNLLKFVETRFYNPSVVSSYVKENATDANIVQNHIDFLQNKFEVTLSEPAVRSSFLYNQSANDIFERSKVYGILMESTAGLQSVQFVDSNGIRIHYSTSARDILSQDQRSTAYRNYTENPTSLPYETVSVQDGDKFKLIMDEQNDRIIFSFPFRDSMNVFRGTALFSVSIRTLAEKLIEEGRLKISESISVINEPHGIILGSPETSKDAVLAGVAEIWKTGVQDYVTLDAEDSGAAFSLISVKTDKNIFFGKLVNSYLFSISEPMKLILNVSIFLTFFLTFFFLINLKPNPVIVVKNRIRRLRESFFGQLDNTKDVQEKAKLVLELEQRKDEIYSQLKRGIKLSRRLEANINNIIDKSWEEIIIYLKISSGHELAAIHLVKDVGKKTATQKLMEEVDVIDEAESLGAEEFDTITEAEPLEEIGEAEAVESIEPIEEFETIEEVKPIEEVEALEEIEEIETIKAAEPHKKAKTAAKTKKSNVIDTAIDAALEPADSKGLLGRASKAKAGGGKKTSAGVASGKGLLSKASKKSTAKKTASGKKGLLASADKVGMPPAKIAMPAATKPSAKGKGLLAHAHDHKKPARRSKGLLAYADEIGYENENEEAQDLNIDVAVVSPFSSMFSSLKKDE